MAVVGRTVRFTCYSTSNTVWTFNGGRLPLNARTYRGKRNEQHILKLIKVKLQNSGLYTCNGEYDSTSFQSDGVLKVVSKL